MKAARNTLFGLINVARGHSPANNELAVETHAGPPQYTWPAVEREYLQD